MTEYEEITTECSYNTAMYHLVSGHLIVETWDGETKKWDEVHYRSNGTVYYSESVSTSPSCRPDRKWRITEFR